MTRADHIEANAAQFPIGGRMIEHDYITSQTPTVTEETSLDALPRIRWRGPDGGWRGGTLVHQFADCFAIAIDDHRRMCVTIQDCDYELDGPRDSAGRLKCN